MFQTYCKTKVKRNMVWNNDFLSQMFCCPELVTFPKTNSDVCLVTHFSWWYILIYSIFLYKCDTFSSCDHWWSWIWKTFWIKATVLLNMKSHLVPNTLSNFLCSVIRWYMQLNEWSPELSSYKKERKHTIKESLKWSTLYFKSSELYTSCELYIKFLCHTFDSFVSLTDQKVIIHW